MFSRDTGFVRRGEDVNRYIEAFHGALNMFQTVAIYPGISKFLHTSIIHHLIGPKPTDKAGPGAFLGVSRVSSIIIYIKTLSHFMTDSVQCGGRSPQVRKYKESTRYFANYD